MQRLRIFFLVCAVCFCTCAALHAQTPARTDTTDRIIYWVHGVNEDKVFWTMYGNYFNQQRLTQGFVQEYASTVAIPTIALRVKSNIDQSVRDGDPKFRSLRKPIFIGHSMGGLVSRTLVRDNPYSNVLPMLQSPYDPLDWGGIISVGTPHLGGHILASVQNGYVDKFLSHAVEELQTVIPLLPVGYSLAVGITAAVATQPMDVLQIPDALQRIVLYPFTSLIVRQNLLNVNSDCMKDMIPTSPFLQSLNANTPNPNIPCLAVFGTSKWQSHLRIGAMYAIKGAHDYPIDQAKDDGLADAAKNVSSWFQHGAIGNSISGVEFTVYQTNPFSWLIGQVHFWIANEYKRAANYIDYGGQIDWAEILNATEVVEKNYNGAVVQGDIANFQWNTSVRLKHTLVKPNDGVVSKASQLFPGSQFPPREARGANHLIQGNHRNVREALENIFSPSGAFPIETKQ